MSESKIRGGAPSRSAADGTQMTADAWRPIETAPKDGTSILVFGHDRMAAVYWWPAVWMGTTHNGMGKPTHWMPLPSPPSEGRLSSISAREAQAEPERPEHKASTSPAVEGEVANLIERLSEFEGSCPCHDCTLHAEAANALERLASEKARLEGDAAYVAMCADRAVAERDEANARADRAVAERDEANARADRAEAERDAATKRAEAAETALKELHAMVWGEAPHLLDEDRAGNARLDLEIEAILNRPHGLTGEGAER